MKRRLLLAAGLSACCTGALAAPPEASPAGFVSRLYDRYRAERPVPFLAVAPAIFDVALLRLIETDRDRAAGEVGLLDFDPICACQDPAGLHGLDVSATPRGDDAADATAYFTISATHLKVGYTLVRRTDGWRIADLSDPDIPSLRAFLEKGLGR